MKKIIRCDNFEREGPGHDDVLLCENVSDEWAKKIVDALIEMYTRDNGQYYYRAVDNDYKLQVFEP